MKTRLSLFGGAIGLLHVAGWGLFAYYSRSYPALAGLGTLAYTFGLRHAFERVVEPHSAIGDAPTHERTCH